MLTTQVSRYLIRVSLPIHLQKMNRICVPWYLCTYEHRAVLVTRDTRTHVHFHCQHLQHLSTLYGVNILHAGRIYHSYVRTYVDMNCSQIGRPTGYVCLSVMCTLTSAHTGRTCLQRGYPAEFNLLVKVSTAPGCLNWYS